jgi:hypothetical protein
MGAVPCRPRPARRSASRRKSDRQGREGKARNQRRNCSERSLLRVRRIAAAQRARWAKIRQRAKTAYDSARKRSAASVTRFPVDSESLRLGCQMSWAILSTMRRCLLTLFAFCTKLAAPSLASAPKSSRQALVPLVRMLSMRRDCHGLHGLRGFLRSRAKLDNLCAVLVRRPS